MKQGLSGTELTGW